MRTGTHFRTCLTVFLMYEVFVLFSKAEQRRPPINDLHARILPISRHLSYNIVGRVIYEALEGRVDDIRALGEEYPDTFIFFAPWLETVGDGTYRENSVWYEPSAAKSIHVLYGLSKLNAILPEVVSRPPAQWQAFPLRHTL